MCVLTGGLICYLSLLLKIAVLCSLRFPQDGLVAVGGGRIELGGTIGKGELKDGVGVG